MALAISGSNDISLTNGQFDEVVDLTHLGQRVKDRLFTFRGEWFLDLQFGVPYLDEILGSSPPNLTVVASILKAEIRKSLEGEAVLTAFQVTFEGATREMKAAFVLANSEGEELSDQFII